MTTYCRSIEHFSGFYVSNCNIKKLHKIKYHTLWRYHNNLHIIFISSRTGRSLALNHCLYFVELKCTWNWLNIFAQYHKQVVQEALDNAQAGRTSIVIAHRLSTVKDAHCIHYLDRGKVLESGTHSVLVDKRGYYWNLLQKYLGNKGNGSWWVE